MAARLHPYRWPLRQAWQGHGQAVQVRRGALLELRDQAGRRGWGDWAPLPGSPEAGDPGLGERLIAWGKRVQDRSPGNLDLASPTTAPAWRCAQEGALLDLEAQALGRPLQCLLAPDPAASVAVNAACGLLDRGAGERLRAALGRGLRVFKFKVGVFPWARERETLQRLAGSLPAEARLRLDANRAWGSDAARRVVADISALPVESLEEPLARPEPEALARLQAEAPFSIALDETLWGAGGRRWLQAPPVRRLVFKPMMMGGPRRVLTWASRLQAQGYEVVVTHALESAVGLMLAAQVAAAGASPLAQGIDPGPWLPPGQAALLPPIEAGQMRLPRKNVWEIPPLSDGVEWVEDA